MTKKISKLTKVNESITIYRYDNGWMAEISGKNKNDDWSATKILCNTETELFDILKEYNSMELDN